MSNEAEFLEAAKAACVSWNLSPLEIEVLSYRECGVSNQVERKRTGSHALTSAWI